MEELKKITRKDGIVYSRKTKKVKLPYKLTLRLTKEERDNLLKLSDIKEVSYAELIRVAIKRFLDEEQELLNNEKY